MVKETERLAAEPVSSALQTLLADKRQAVTRENRRLIKVGDAEALHDLRVALRRMHSIFVAFSPLFSSDNTLPPSLHKLQKSTNHARDLEVLLTRLRDCGIELPWLTERWQRQLQSEYERLGQTLPRAWASLEAGTDTFKPDIAPEQPEQSLGAFAAPLLESAMKRLKRKRRTLCHHWNDRRAHKLRIQVKQMRYLLELFTAESRSAEKAVKQLKTLQDSLGDYHDSVVLLEKMKQEPAEKFQLEAVKKARRTLKAERRKLRRKLVRQLCGKKRKQLNKRLKRARRSLAKT